MSAPMVILAGTVRIKPGMKDKALPHMRAMVAASRAEPGCVQYAFSFDMDDDHLVRIFEVFADEAARVAHRESPHMAAWRAGWDETGIGDRNMSEWRVAAP